MPNRLSRLFSSSKEKEALALAEAERNASPEPPPSYDQENTLEPPNITAGFKNLTLSSQAQDGFPTPDEAIAHLKVLECFYHLRQTIGSRDGLFGISNAMVLDSGVPANDKTPELLAKLAEKRWAVYVQRAVDRFEVWWSAILPQARPITRNFLETHGPNGTLVEPLQDEPISLQLNDANLPPPDVLMVWHAYMLNPRAYLEDCLRHGRMSLWRTKFPWKAVSDSINSETFAMEASETAQNNFRSLTLLPWGNQAGSATKTLPCATCKTKLEVDYTTCFEKAPTSMYGSGQNADVLADHIDHVLSSGSGFCDKDFSAICSKCSYSTTHDTLKASKFLVDLQNLLDADVPMGGTVLGDQGIPWKAFGTSERLMEYYSGTPNHLLASGKGKTSEACLGECLLNDRAISGQRIDASSMSAIRDIVEDTLKDRAFLKQIRQSASPRLLRFERIAIRKMMSRYWENSSSFALDLVGAVIRQGSFVEKMHNIDWLHSPALLNTMRRLVVKYERFIGIIAANKNRMAVPTLDVDLAWHTHQLNSYGYMAYTVKLTKQFIDHDDKVAETRLNDSFAWTSKQYMKMFNEPYSECGCWYCEAVRESTTSSASRLFNGSTAKTNDLLHNPDQDPRKSVHISAHNAVRPTDDDKYLVDAAMKAKELDKAYEKACERARKKNKPEPKRDDYYYSDAYGYPVYIPAYSPYIGYVPYCPIYYPVTPGCMALGAGAVGNCCAGTCGGGVAAGACGGGGGGCAGGAAGGCGGSSGGGCGGGGGGGCGGGGGGC